MPFTYSGGSRSRRDPLQRQADAMSQIRQRTDNPVSDVEARAALASTSRRAENAMADPASAVFSRNDVEALRNIQMHGYEAGESGWSGVGKAAMFILNLTQYPANLVKYWTTRGLQAESALLNNENPFDGLSEIPGDYWRMLSGHSGEVNDGILEKGWVDLFGEFTGNESWAYQDTDNTMERYSRNAMNFALDLLADPLSYFGGAGLVRSAGVEAAEGGAKFAVKAATRDFLPKIFKELVGDEVETTFLRVAEDAAGKTLERGTVKGVLSESERALTARVLDKSVHAKTLAREIMTGASETEIERAVQIIDAARQHGGTEAITTLTNGVRASMDDARKGLSTVLHEMGTPPHIIDDALENAVNPPRLRSILREAEEVTGKKIDDKTLGILLGKADGPALLTQNGLSALSSQLTTAGELGAQTGARLSGAVTTTEIAETLTDDTLRVIKDITTLQDFGAGMDNLSENLLARMAKGIVNKDLRVIPEDIAAHDPTHLAPGLLIKNPLGEHVFGVVPHTEGLMNRVTVPLRSIRNDLLKDNKLYTLWKKARTGLSYRYSMSQSIRESASGDVNGIMNAIAQFKNKTANPMVRWAHSLVPQLNAASLRVSKAVGNGDEAAAHRAITRILDAGQLIGPDSKFGVRNVANKTEQILDEEGITDEVLRSAVLEEAANLRASVYHRARVEMQDRGVDIDGYSNYANHVLSSDVPDILNRIVSGGVVTEAELDAMGPGGTLLVTILDNVNPEGYQSSILIGQAAHAKHRKVGVGLFADVPIHKLRDAIISVAASMDSTLHTVRARARRTMRKVFVSAEELGTLSAEDAKQYKRELSAKLVDAALNNDNMFESTNIADGVAGQIGVAPVAKFTHRDKWAKAVRATGGVADDMYELPNSSEGARVFHDAIQSAADSHKFGSSVTVYSAEEYSDGMRLFLSADKKYGFAITKDGQLVSVFNHSATDGSPLMTMIPLAIKNGAYRADAYDTVLPEFYSAFGFMEQTRLRFDPNYAPDNWSFKDYEKFNNGQPDIVFMNYVPEEAGVNRVKAGRYVTDYDDGLKSTVARGYIDEDLAKNTAQELIDEVGDDIEGASFGVVQMNDLMNDALATLVDMRGLKVKGGKPLRVFEEDPFLAADAYAQAAASSMVVHDAISIAIRYGGISDKALYTNVSEWMNNVMTTMPDSVTNKQITLKRKYNRVAVEVDKLGETTPVKLGGRGRSAHSTVVHVNRDVAHSKEGQAVIAEANATLAELDALRAEVEQQKKVVVAHLRKDGVPEEMAQAYADMLADATTQEARSALDTLAQRNTAKLQEVVSEVATHTDDMTPEDISNSILRTEYEASLAIIEKFRERVPYVRTTSSHKVTKAELNNAADILSIIAEGGDLGYVSDVVMHKVRTQLDERLRYDVIRRMAKRTGTIDDAGYKRARNSARRAAYREGRVDQMAVDMVFDLAGVEHIDGVTTIPGAWKKLDKEQRARLLFNLSSPDDLKKGAFRSLNDSLHARASNDLKQQILSAYADKFTPRQLNRILTKSADTFDDEFFRSAIVRNVVGRDELQKQITNRAHQAAAEVMSRDARRTPIVIGDTKFRRGVIDATLKSWRETGEITDQGHQKVFEALLREGGVAGTFSWKDGTLKVTTKIEDVADLVQFDKLRKSAADRRMTNDLINAVRRGNIKRAREIAEANDKTLRAYGLKQDANRLIRQAEESQNVRSAVDTLIDRANTYQHSHDFGVDKGIDSISADVETKLDEMVSLSQREAIDTENAPELAEQLADVLLHIYSNFVRDAETGNVREVLRILDDEASAGLREWMNEAYDLADKLSMSDETKRALKESPTKYHNVGKSDGLVTQKFMNIDGPTLDAKLIDKTSAEFIRAAVWNAQMAYTPHGTAALSAIMQSVQSFWKQEATIWRPKFHIRNLIGGAYNSLITGAGPLTYASVATPVRKFRNALKRGLDLEEALVHASDDDNMRLALRWAANKGIFNTTFVASNERSVRNALKKETMAFANPLDDKFILTQGGASVMEAVEDLHRFAVFYKHFDPTDIETARTAAGLVNAVHFDYSREGNTELTHSITKYIPFFVWTKNNVPLQIATLVEQPRVLSRYMHFMNFMENTLSETEESRYNDYAMPKYLGAISANTDIMAHPGTPFWGRLLLSPDVPVNDILSLEPLSVESWASTFENSLTPLVTLPMELSNIGSSHRKVNANWYVPTALGSGRSSYIARAVTEDAFPVLKEYTQMFGLEQDPTRLARMGVAPEDNQAEKTARSMLQGIGSGAFGAQYQNPTDSNQAAASASERVANILREARHRQGMPK